MPRVLITGTINQERLRRAIPETLARVLEDPLNGLKSVVIFDDTLFCTGISADDDPVREMQKCLAEAIRFCETITIQIGDMSVEPSPLPAPEPANEWLSKDIEELNLSVRAGKGCYRLGIKTIAQLVDTTADELLKIKNFGVTSLYEVRDKLSVKSLKLKGD